MTPEQESAIKAGHACGKRWAKNAEPEQLERLRAAALPVEWFENERQTPKSSHRLYAIIAQPPTDRYWLASEQFWQARKCEIAPEDPDFVRAFRDGALGTNLRETKNSTRHRPSAYHCPECGELVEGANWDDAFHAVEKHFHEHNGEVLLFMPLIQNICIPPESHGAKSIPVNVSARVPHPFTAHRLDGFLHLASKRLERNAAK